jgi:hypothetical protein
MKLSDCDPRWTKATNPDDGGRPDGQGMGLSFLSPLGTGVRINIWFANPLDGGSPINDPKRPRQLWKRTGETFDTLTLTPSVDASPDWHGHIKDGNMVGGGVP